MKILYVEDELSENIPRITRLFSKFMGRRRCKELETLSTNETGFRPDLEKVKALVEETNIIEVERSFPEALRKIVYMPNRYALFLVDRNLSESEYEYEEVKAIDPLYNETHYETFFEREGDYCLHRLLYHPQRIDVMTKFYFLTAYSVQDELRNAEEIKTHINFGQFTTNNFIEKGDGKALERLQHIIENINILNMQIANRYYLNVLRNNLNEKVTESFLKVLEERNDLKRVGDNLKEMRNIREDILKGCCERIPDMQNSCKNQHGNVILGGETVNWLSDNGYINSIRKEFLFDLMKIASEFGSHPHSESPTIDAINALVYQLKDIISWFDSICKKYPK